ncbi:LysM peptidoglycan-binding domain-containing protein [Bradyrhizobium xenonodulans]|uniref:LysM peptidoglycan-binding domain-containing protein n=1 Tax=Bradyrhizobium xenonodulans TaxID=2736875 RepID=A0ABY7MSJ2_9BRAD|nr:LysM domain-containing protein [Bradyrhizobium xenonodulans]WBL81352.1 LysM peptidoglycan-binding domain-containing protein [Bradyrhizobium xenonodulans]
MAVAAAADAAPRKTRAEQADTPVAQPKPSQKQDFDTALAAAKREQDNQPGSATPASDTKPADNTPRTTIDHKVEPGESLARIAKHYRTSYADVLNANKDRKNPDLIHPGDHVTVPNADQRVVTAEQQVDAAHKAEDSVASLEHLAHDPKGTDQSRAVAASQLADARAEVGHRWDDVQKTIETDLRDAGKTSFFPDDAANAAVGEIRGRLPKDQGYQSAVDRAQATVKSDWDKQGISLSHFQGLVDKANKASGPGADAAWKDVRGAIENRLRDLGNGQAYPEERVKTQLDEIKQHFAKDPKIGSQVDDAYKTVTGEWHDQGWTRDTLGVVVDKYDDVRKAQSAVDEAKKTGTANAPQLQQNLTTAQNAVRQEIERQLDDVAGKVPKDKRELAIAARAALIQSNGPQEEGFSSLVDEAAYNKTVKPGVDAVQAAYKKDGAKAAADALNAQTSSVSPETAKQIVAASMPTIDAIAADLDKSMRNGDGPISYKDYNAVYGDLAAATDMAARGTNGQKVVDDVAATMIRHLPSQKFQPQFQDSPSYPLQPYQQAVMQSVLDGKGASLQLATTTQLKASGRTSEADSLVSAISVGAQGLKGRVEDDVKTFSEASGDITRLRADWSGVMSKDKLDAATIDYLNRNPGVLPKFDQSYNALDGDGYAVARTNLAIDAALPQLQGLSQTAQLADAKKDLGESKEAQFAVGISDKASDEVLRQVLANEVPAGAKANPNSSIGGSRNFVKELGNAAMQGQPSALGAIGASNTGAARKVTDLFTGQSVAVDPKKMSLFGGGMNGLGAAFSGYQTYLSYEKLAKGGTTMLDKTKAVYYAMGTVKESAEGLAVMAQRGWLGLDRIPGAQQLSGTLLEKANRTGLLSEPGWVRFSTFFKIGGGLIDAGYAVDAASKGDMPAALLYGTSAGGGFLAAAGSVAASDSWLATFGGPVGAGVVLASAVGLYLYNDAKDKARFEGPSREFLESAGYDPKVASALADYDNNDGRSAGPALAAAARQFGISPEELMQRLNKQDPDKVHDLIHEAWTVEPDDKGNYPLTAANDRTVWAPGAHSSGHYLYDPQDTRYRGGYGVGAGGAYLNEDPNAHSLTALRDYARALFGQPVLG